MAHLTVIKVSCCFPNSNVQSIYYSKQKREQACHTTSEVSNHQLLFQLAFSLLWKGTMIMVTLIQEKYLTETADYWFRGSVYSHHGVQHGSMEADVVL